MSRLISVTSSAILEEVRDGQSFPVVFFTAAGRNGVRAYQLTDQARIPVDLTGKTIKLVVKTGPDAANTELSAAMPLTATLTNPAQGLMTFDFTAVTFAAAVGYVIVVLYDATGGITVPLAQMRSSIAKAGV